MLLSRLAIVPQYLPLPCVPLIRALVLLCFVPLAAAQVPDLRTYQWIRSSDKAFIQSLPAGFQYLPAGLTPEDVKDMEVQCVQMINSYRNGSRTFSDGTIDSNVAAGLFPLRLNCGMAPCSGSQAMGDLINNVAGGGGCAGAHSTAFTCNAGGMASLAQNSCCGRGGGANGPDDTATYTTKSAILAELSSCLQEMWDEGITPGGMTGHWQTMRSTVFTQVTCGFAWTTTGRIMMNQDFSSAPMRCDSCTCNTCSGNEPCSNKTCVCSPGVSRPPSTSTPTSVPTLAPTTRTPTHFPTTQAPTGFPTNLPTSQAPTSVPTTRAPTLFPTLFPTTQAPTLLPTTQAPTGLPTLFPTTRVPTTQVPTQAPTLLPTAVPSFAPTATPTSAPTTTPTTRPTALPTLQPSSPTVPLSGTSPSASQPTSRQPTARPTRTPTNFPTHKPTKAPTTRKPTKFPTLKPTRKPTNTPTTKKPTLRPTTKVPTIRTSVPTTRTATQWPSSSGKAPTSIL